MGGRQRRQRGARSAQRPGARSDGWSGRRCRPISLRSPQGAGAPADRPVRLGDRRWPMRSSRPARPRGTRRSSERLPGQRPRAPESRHRPASPAPTRPSPRIRRMPTRRRRRARRHTRRRPASAPSSTTRTSAGRARSCGSPASPRSCCWRPSASIVFQLLSGPSTPPTQQVAVPGVRRQATRRRDPGGRVGRAQARRRRTDVRPAGRHDHRPGSARRDHGRRRGRRSASPSRPASSRCRCPTSATRPRPWRSRRS